MKVTTSALMALAATAEFAVAQTPLQPPITSANNQGAATSQGCFKSKGDWDFYKMSPMSSGGCNDKGICDLSDKKYTVSALTADGCFCGFEYPPKADLVDDKYCNYPCPAWNAEACGGYTDDGEVFYSVYNLGVKIVVPNKAADSSSSTSSSIPDSSVPAATSGQSQPAASSSAPDEDNNDGGPSLGGIVGGVVGGVAVVGLLASIVFFVWRRRRNMAIEEEHRRNATVNSFISGAKPASSSGLSMTDSRMDPGMAHQRRLSDGSIADNQDYSRKILRVTNA